MSGHLDGFDWFDALVKLVTAVLVAVGLRQADRLKKLEADFGDAKLTAVERAREAADQVREDLSDARREREQQIENVRAEVLKRQERMEERLDAHARDTVAGFSALIQQNSEIKGRLDTLLQHHRGPL